MQKKKQKNTQPPKPKSIFSIKSTYKTTLQLLCVRFFLFSLIFISHTTISNGPKLLWLPANVRSCMVCMCIELSLNLNLKSNCQYKIRCQSNFYLFFGDEIWWASKAWKTFFSHTLFSLSILIHIEVFFFVFDALSHKSERLLMNDGTIYATCTRVLCEIINHEFLPAIGTKWNAIYTMYVFDRLNVKKSNGISRSTEQIVIPHQNTRRIRKKNLFSIHFAH